jgi:ABC-type sugar transport system permease subunit
MSDNQITKLGITLIVCTIGLVIAQAFTPEQQYLNVVGTLFAIPWCISLVFLVMGCLFRWLDDNET